MLEFHDEIDEPFFELSQFLSSVFNQDFSLSFDSELAGATYYLAGADQIMRVTLVAELDALSEQATTEGQLQDALEALGSGYVPPATPKPYADFVQRLRTFTASSI